MATAEKPVLSKYRDRMDKAVGALKEEFASLRTGRASASLLDQIHVEAYGSTMPLNQVAAISVPEPRMITVNVWDRGMVVSVEKAIRSRSEEHTSELPSLMRISYAVFCLK